MDARRRTIPTCSGFRKTCPPHGLAGSQGIVRVDLRQSGGLTLPQVRRSKNGRLALFRQTGWVGEGDP